MLRNQGIIFFALWIAFSSCSGLKLPASLERCKVSSELDGKSNECLVKAMNAAISKLTGGNKELGVPALDPLKIKEMKIEQGGSSPVAIKLHFTDCDLIGSGNAKITAFGGKLSSPDGFNAKVKLTVPVLTVSGPYEISGKVLILPIEGVGHSNITLYDSEYQIDIKGEKQIKNGEEYLKITGFKVNIINPKDMKTHFGNLFKGDKALGDNTNLFLNENWKDIFQELKPATENAFSAVFEAYTKRIMERIAFKDIFITE